MTDRDGCSRARRRHWLPRLGGTAILLACLSVSAVGRLATQAEDAAARRLPKLPPFLEVFTQPRAAVVFERAQWFGATGKRSGLLFRPAGDERMPALLLIPGERGYTEWERRSAEELASIGYLVLAVVLEEGALPPAPGVAAGSVDPVAQERALADLCAAARWLRRRADVFPARVGAVGRARGGSWAWSLAAASGLQAAVNIDGAIPDDPALLAGLHGSALMAVWSGKPAAANAKGQRAEIRRALERRDVEHELREFADAGEGFMDPDQKGAYRRADAERAWFLVYEFLAEHVEDAAIKSLLAERERSGGEAKPGVATIADLMRAVNAPTGVRGDLARLLDEKPQSKSAWRDVESRAALMAEVGELLLRRRPPKGSQAQWLKHAESYREAAVSLRDSAEQHDYPRATAGLKQIAATCAACHLQHR